MSKVTLYTEVNTEEKFDFPIRSIAGKVCRRVLKVEKFPFDAEISLTLVDNEEIKELNNSCRGIDKVTDVLSFPNLEYEKPSDFENAVQTAADCMDPDTGCVLLGDIVLNAVRVKEQAEEYGHSELREFAFLIAHSMYHLCGYDHMTEKEAAEMEEKQEYILQLLGITREGEALAEI